MKRSPYKVKKYIEKMTRLSYWKNNKKEYSSDNNLSLFPTSLRRTRNPEASKIELIRKFTPVGFRVA
jgi:hypothetical protein